MTKVFTIAFLPFDSTGHVNSCLSLGHSMAQLGHNCVFIVNQTWKDLIARHGFDCKIFVEEHKGKDQNQYLNDFMVQFGPTLKLSSFDKIRAFETPSWEELTSDVQKSDNAIKEIINGLKPDAIVVDSFLCSPSAVCAGIPWINLMSCNPLYYISDKRLPPGGSGYATNGDKKLWQKFYNETVDSYGRIWQQFNTWVQSKGAPALEFKEKFTNNSPFLNLYLCPQELDYNEIAPKDQKWFSIDSTIRLNENQNTFEIPDQLRERSGKLIYLSMGTLCCSELELMKRLIGLLSKSRHRFIVSKGPLGQNYHLSDNMWGQNHLPQLQVLPIVDLVLTHGGNNTVSETLYFGKPMIVLPVFADQYDNAQRVVEKGLGVRLDPYFCTQSELFDAIETLVNDFDLKKRYEDISRRMKANKSKEMSAKLIEEIINNSKSFQK